MTKKPTQHPDYEKAPMSRRQFIRGAAAAGSIAGAAGYLAWAPAEWPLSMKDKTGLRSVPVIKPYTIPDYRMPKPTGAPDVVVSRVKGDDPERNLARALDKMGGLKNFIDPGDIVLVKPNVAFDRSPNLGATSNPKLLKELIDMLHKAGAKEVRVADNPIESPPDCFAKSKIGQYTKMAGGRVYLPDSNAFDMLATPGAELIKEWWFFRRPFENVDKVIGLAPIKDHNLCHASMGIKNWYGLLGGTRNQFHQNIHAIVSDLSIMIKPTLTILDGTHVLMQNGPTGGDPSNVRRDDAVIVAVDPVAADAWAFEYLLRRGRDYPAYLHKAEEKHKAMPRAGFTYSLNWNDRLLYIETA